MNKITTLLSLLVICISSKAAPIAYDDLSGLGQSILAKKLRSSIFVGNSTVQKSVTKLVNQNTILSSTDRRAKLIDLGFICSEVKETECSYIGVAKTRVKNAEEKHPRLIIIKVMINAEIQNEKIVISSNLERSSTKD